MRIFVAFSALFLFVAGGCTSVKCLLKDKASAAITNVVAEKLQCENSAAIKVSMDKLIASAGICTEAKTGPIASAVCPILVKSVVDFLTDKSIPAEWMCKATDAKAFLSVALTEACSKIPVSE